MYSLSADENKINEIERNKREQLASDECKKERTYRFAASRFQSITNRGRNHYSFPEANTHPSQNVAHGLKYELVDLQVYQKFMCNQRAPVAVLRSGFVVFKSCPELGTSPDAKIVDKGCSVCFGLGAFLMSLHLKFHVTPLEHVFHGESQ